MFPESKPDVSVEIRFEHRGGRQMDSVWRLLALLEAHFENSQKGREFPV